jgi:hypothetical protein
MVPDVDGHQLTLHSVVDGQAAELLFRPEPGDQISGQELHPAGMVDHVQRVEMGVIGKGQHVPRPLPAGTRHES